jgi:hypothetical protein
MAGQRPEKTRFIEELTEVKKRLPPHYGVLVRTVFPKFKKSNIDNVVQRQVVNWDILDALKKIADEFGDKN